MNIAQMHLPINIKLKGLNKEEKIFCWLFAVVGMAQNDAYLAAFPDTKATRQSASAMASRFVRSDRIQDALKTLHNGWLKASWDYNPNATPCEL